MPVSSWSSLNTLLTGALKVISTPFHRYRSPPTQGYNELNAAMDLVLFEDAMSLICRVIQVLLILHHNDHHNQINRAMESPRSNLLLVGVGGSGKQSLSRLAAYISSMEVFQMTLSKGYGIPDMMKDLATLYIKTGIKNIGTVFLMSDAQVSGWIHESFS